MKARVMNTSTIARRLATLGAEMVGEGVQVDTYLDTPDRKLRRRGEAMRVRRCPPAKGGAITFKGRRVGKDIKKREEIQAPVDDAATLISILKMAGLKALGNVRKQRRVFHYGGTSITLDRVAGLGNFIEAEIMSDGKASLKSQRSVLLRVIREVAGKDAVIEPQTYLEMILEQQSGRLHKGAANKTQNPSSSC